MGPSFNPASSSYTRPPPTPVRSEPVLSLSKWPARSPRSAVSNHRPQHPTLPASPHRHPGVPGRDPVATHPESAPKPPLATRQHQMLPTSASPFMVSRAGVPTSPCRTTRIFVGAGPRPARLPRNHQALPTPFVVSRVVVPGGPCRSTIHKQPTRPVSPQHTLAPSPTPFEASAS